MVNFVPLAAEIVSLVWGTPANFNVSRLGSVTARHCSSGHQPNFPALNRWRHLYLAGRPSRWALAHILVCFWFKPVLTDLQWLKPHDWQKQVFVGRNPTLCCSATGLGGSAHNYFNSVQSAVRFTPYQCNNCYTASHNSIYIHVALNSLLTSITHSI